MNIDKLMTAYRAAGQEQVFAFWQKLSFGERSELSIQAAEVDLAEVERLNRTLVLTSPGSPPVNLKGLATAPCVRLPTNGGHTGEWAKARAAGEAALGAGRVAAFTVAGGQGTRLGYHGPKGTFAVTPLRHKPLFQVFAEKIKASGLRHGRPLHWFIMTSHANHEQTGVYFAKHHHFGLDRGRVHFICQGRMPAVDFNGKIMLETKSALALSPDGHGGSLRALHRSGALDLMQSEGVDTISYFQVDNPLVRVMDASFIGFHLRRGSEMSSKMVPKVFPEEKIGCFCARRRKIVVVEYSDLPLSRQRETNPDGTLRFGAGSIAIHVIDREFARRMAGGSTEPGTGSVEPALLPFHRADKMINTIDAKGRPVKPAKANGVKFEMFVFDALPFARNPVVIETARADDFSPVKNAEGVDTPQTARDDQLRQYGRWLKAAGAAIAIDATGRPRCGVEISPLFGDDADSFTERWRRLPVKPEIIEGLYLE